MMLHVRTGRVMALACALVALSLVSSRNTFAAPSAAELGPVIAAGEPSGGFVGQLKVTPEHGPVGTPVTVTGEGFPAGQNYQLVWSTVKGSWKTTIAEYLGREYTPINYQIATARAASPPGSMRRKISVSGTTSCCSRAAGYSPRRRSAST